MHDGTDKKDHKNTEVAPWR